jgi:hypothetical protein
MMKRHLLSIAMASSLLAAPVFAEPKPAAKATASDSKGAADSKEAADSKGAADAANMEILRQKIKSDKKLIVAENMDLTDAEAKKFWPIYDAYQKDLGKINQRISDLVSGYISGYNKGPISNDASKKIVADTLDIEKAETDLKRSYLAKFDKALPPYKVARYAQIENKIRALVKYELAVEIPLMD